MTMAVLNKGKLFNLVHFSGSMMKVTLAAVLLVCAFDTTRGFSHSLEKRQENVQAAAAAGGADCYCQCSSYTYVDRNGVTNGNCKSTYNNKQWCYIENYPYDDCQDIQTSDSGRKWSFQACATPSLTSPECCRPIPGGCGY